MMQLKTGDTNEVYASPREAALLFLLPGLVQGLGLYGLTEFAEQSEPGAWLVAAFLFALIAPTAHSLTTTRSTRLPAIIFSVVLGGSTAALYLLAEASFGNSDGVTEAVLAVSLVADFIICYVSAPFFRTIVERQQPYNHYPSLFEYAWNLPVIGLAAAFFTGAVWIVLAIWAALFNLIGIDLFSDLFFDALFALPATFGAGAIAIGIVRERESIVLALRSVLFALLKVLSPILALATILFAFSALAQGLDQLWDGWSAASLMVCAIAAAIILSNAVIGEAGTPQSAVLRWSARLQLAVLPLLACFALYAMYLRLSEYGLTIARIYALILVLFAAAYAIAGFVSALMPTGYTFLRQANIWLAGALFAVAVLVQTPLFNTWQMTVDDQVARLEDGRISAADFDYAYFQFELGSAGKRALQELKEAENIPDHDFVVAQIERVEQAENRYDFNSVTMPGSASQLVEDGSIEILPAGTVLDQSFIDYLERERWLIDECRNVETGNTCLLLETDIFPVGSAYLYVRVIDSGYMTIQLFYQDQGETWRQAYGETVSATSDTERDAFLDRLRSGAYQGGTITFRTIQIGNKEIFFLGDDEELRRIMRIPE